MVKSIRPIAIGLTLVLVQSFTASPIMSAQSDSDTIVGVKSALVYETSRLVTWPGTTFKSKNETLVIGVLGNNRIRKELAEETKGRKIGGHPVKVTSVSLDDDWSSLHILYVDSSATEDFIKVDKTDYAKSPILTLGDTATFAERGGVIQLFIVDNKPIIRINVDALERKKLGIDIRLLEVSDVIHDAS